MVRSVVSKVMWVGRATVFLVGLSVILAVIFGVASMALGADGQPFLLGKKNVASSVSKLVKNGPGPALKLIVNDGQPPLSVTSSGKVANLNADQLDGKSEVDFLAINGKAADSDELDGKDSSEFAGSAHTHSGADITSGTVAEARIDGAIARDNEIMPTVTANDGSGSGLDADKLDGEDLEDVLPGGTPPSGTTIRGTYNMYDEAHMAGDATSGSISFGYTLASAPTVRVIEQGESLTTQCPQRGDDFTGEVPEAAPGYLCIYEWEEFNELNGSGYPFLSNTNRTGIGITLRSESTGIFYSEGVWAVTAP